MKNTKQINDHYQQQQKERKKRRAKKSWSVESLVTSAPKHLHTYTYTSIKKMYGKWSYIFTVNIPDWRLRKQDTYSINFYLNVNKCRPASILESPLAPNSYRYHSYKSKHAENTLQAVVAMGLVSENRLIIQTKWVSTFRKEKDRMKKNQTHSHAHTGSHTRHFIIRSTFQNGY